MLTYDRARELFEYDPETGNLLRKVRYGRPCTPPKPMRTLDKRGYFQVNIKGEVLKVHRVVWLLAYGSFPNGYLDHINGDKTDNRLSNLRVVSHRENIRNSKARSNSTTGLKGVRRTANPNRWRAGVKVADRHIHLGYFDTPEEAHLAYCKAASKYFGEHFCDGKR